MDIWFESLDFRMDMRNHAANIELIEKVNL